MDNHFDKYSKFFFDKMVKKSKQAIEKINQKYGVKISNDYEGDAFYFDFGWAKGIYEGEKSKKERLDKLRSGLKKEDKPEAKNESVYFSYVLSRMLSFFCYAFLKYLTEKNNLKIYKDGKSLPADVDNFIPSIVLATCLEIMPSSLEEMKKSEGYFNKEAYSEREKSHIGLVAEFFWDVLSTKGLSAVDLKRMIEEPD
jgi:hypothetical protein